MNPAELAIHRANTKAFIAARPSLITLIPRSKERTAGGGYKLVDGEPREPQVMRIIEQGTTAGTTLRGQNGEQSEVSYMLLAEHDAELAVDDHWHDGEKLWEIVEVIIPNGYEQRALVVERG